MDYILSIVILACINMIAVLGLSIFTGFTGLFSLGHAAFVAVGAYTSAILTYYYYVPFYLALAAGAAAAGLVSLVIGVPTLRAKLRSDYFAIAILGFGEALRVILENLEITNGARGLPWPMFSVTKGRSVSARWSAKCWNRRSPEPPPWSPRAEVFPSGATTWPA